MTSEDRQQRITSSSSRQRNPFQKLTALFSVSVTKPRGYVILLISAAFFLGYLSHSSPFLSFDANDMYHHNTFKPTDCAADPVPPPLVRQTILHRVFNGSSPWDGGFPPPHVAPLLLQEWTKGWGSNAPVFEHLMRKVRPRVVIEVGTFLGASAIHMAGLANKLGLESTTIICIDDFRGWPGYYDEGKSLRMVNGDSLLLYQFMQNVARANATETIMYLPFSTGTALAGLCEWGVYGDLVEVDAAHDFHSAWTDINNAYKVLRRPGGVLFGHDYVWSGVRKAVHSFARRNGFRVRIDGEHWILY